MTKAHTPTPEKALRSSAEIKAEIQTFPRWQRLLRLNLLSARNRVQELRQSVLLYSMQANTHLNITDGSDENHVGNAAGTFANPMSIESLFQPLAAAESVLRVLEADEQHTTALARLQPLIDELAAAEQRELEELHEASRAQQALREAREAARAAFEAGIDQVPIVAQAKAKVSPFYRKGILVSE